MWRRPPQDGISARQLSQPIQGPTGLATAAVAGLALLALAATALATDPSGVVSTTLAQGNVDDIHVKVRTGDWKIKVNAQGPSSLAISEIHVAPGGSFGWHSHPGPSFVVVKSGTSTFYDGSDRHCRPQVHPAGTAYVDPGGDVQRRGTRGPRSSSST